EQESFYLTQGGLDDKDAVARGDFKTLEYPTRFVFGKSLVGGSKTGDVFENVVPGAIAYVRPSAAPMETHPRLSLQLAGQWAFFPEFWRAHALEQLADLLPTPEFGIFLGGGTIEIPLTLQNDTDADQEVTLSATLPKGWADQMSYSTYPVRAKSTYPVHRFLAAPATGKLGWYEVTWKAEAGGRQIG